MNHPLDNVVVVPVGTGMAILTEDGQLNPAFIHAMIRAHDAATARPQEPPPNANRLTSPTTSKESI